MINIIIYVIKKELKYFETKKTIISEKYQYETSHYVKNKNSIDPEIKGCITGQTWLEDIFKFLKSWINYKVNWQNYITNASKKYKKKD